MKKRTFNAILSDEQHAKFKYHCTMENVTVLEKMTELIIEYLDKKTSKSIK